MAKKGKKENNKTQNNSNIKNANNHDQMKTIEENEDDKIKRILGFDDFATSKNKSHTHSDESGVFLGYKVKSKFRQYVNRRCGFNKPLGRDK